MSNAVMPLSDYVDVCDKIRKKTNSTDKIKSGDLAAKVDEVYEAGKASGGSEDYLQYAKTVQFNSLNDFGKAEVELNLGKCTDLYLFCRVTTATQQNTTVEHLTINNAIPVDMRSFLDNVIYTHRDFTLKRLTLNFDTSKVKYFERALNSLSALETIDGKPLDFSGIDTTKAYATQNLFSYCNALKEVRFVNNSIPMSVSFSNSNLLSAESIQSIIDGLADLTGGTAQTLTLHATVGAKLTDTQKATITAKNWKLVY